MRASTFTTYINAELDPGIQNQVQRQEKLFVDSYGRIARSAEQATRATANLVGGRGTGGLSANRDLTSRTAAITDLSRAATQAQRASLSTAAALAVETRASNLASTSQARLAANLRTSATALTVVQGPLGPLAGRVTAAANAIERLTGLRVGLVGAAAALVAFVRVGSEYQNLASRVRPFYDTQVQANNALNNIIGIAQRAHAALNPVADLYIKIKNAGAGLTEPQIGHVSELAAKAATLSGGTRQVQEAGLTQFAQAVGAGRLGGQDLRALLEDIPVLGQAIARGFQNADGTIGTTVGKLRELGKEGDLPIQKVLDALNRSGDILNLQYSRLPLTVTRSLTDIENAFEVYIGRADDSVGTTSKLASVIELLANNLRGATALAVGFGASFAAGPALRSIELLNGKLANGVQLVRALSSGGSFQNGQAGFTVLNSPAARVQKATFREVGAHQASQAAAAAAADAQALAAAQAQEEAAIRSKVEAEILDQRVAEAVAAKKVELAQAVALAERTELETLVAIRAERETQLRALDRGQQLIIANPSLNDGTRSAMLGANTEAQTQARVRLSGANTLAEASAGRLADAEHALALAENEEAVARVTANEAAAGGLARMEALAAAAIATANAEKEVTVATAAAAAAQVEFTEASVASRAAQVALAAATSLLGGAVRLVTTVVKTLGSVLLSANVIIGLLTAGFFLLATRTNYTKDAIDSFNGGQEELRRRAGLATEALAGQTAQARQLAQELARGALVKAKSDQDSTRTEVGNSLNVARNRIDLSSASGRHDFELLKEVIQRIETGTTRGGDQKRIFDIKNRNPEAFEGNAALKFLNLDASDPASLILGLKARQANKNDAQAAYEATLKPISTTPLTAVPQPAKTSDIDAQARLAALNGDNTVAERANRTRTAAIDQLNAKYKPFIKDGQVAGEKVEAYTKEITLIEQQYNKTIELGRAEKENARSATSAQRQHVEDLRRLDAEQKQQALADAATKRDTSLSQLEDQSPDLSRQQYLDQRIAILRTYDQEVDAIKGTDGVSRAAAAQQLKDSAAIAKARRDIVDSYEQQRSVSLLSLQGRDVEAEALRKTLSYQADLGDRALDFYNTLVRQGREEAHINSLLASRNRITDSITGAVDDARQGFEKLLEDAPNGAGKAGLAYIKGLQASFSRISATRLTESLFAGTDEKVRALLEGKSSVDSKFDEFGTSLSTASISVDQFVRALERGTAAIGQTAITSGEGSGGLTSGGISTVSGAVQDALKTSDLVTTDSISRTAASLGAALGLKAPTAAGNQDASSAEDIVVTANRTPSLARGLRTLLGGKGNTPGGKETFSAIFGQVGANFDTSLHKAFSPVGGGKSILGLGDTTFFSKLGTSVGAGLQGAQTGALVAGVGKALGVHLNSTGAQIGGGIGGAIGAALPIPGGQLIGSLLGSLGGGVIGNLLTKPKQGGSTVQLDQFGNFTAGAAFGNSGSAKKAATGDATNIANALQTIEQSLGANFASLPSVSIGTYKGKYRVNTQGTKLGGSKSPVPGLTDFGDDEQAAITFAIQQTIAKSVITGISQASVNILKSGQDLQQAIQKATIIESIPKQLEALTDPVRYAVDQLNDSFKNTITVLKEGGATAEQFAQAQQLYDRQRADAIKQATNNATQAITSFLNDMNGGSGSPLNKLDTYRNANSVLSGFRTDIQAGKQVDQDQLLAAAKNFEEASQALNGSNSSFFTDFNALRDLLNQAVGNATSTAAGTPLPASPFETDTSVQTTLKQLQDATTSATQTQTQQLSDKLDQVVSAIGGLANLSGYSGYGPGGTAMALLPGVYR